MRSDAPKNLVKSLLHLLHVHVGSVVVPHIQVLVVALNIVIEEHAVVQPVARPTDILLVGDVRGRWEPMWRKDVLRKGNPPHVPCAHLPLWLTSDDPLCIVAFVIRVNKVPVVELVQVHDSPHIDELWDRGCAPLLPTDDHGILAARNIRRRPLRAHVHLNDIGISRGKK